MKAFVSYTTFLLLCIAVLSCSKQKTEKDYFDQASGYMEQQNWAEAEKNFQQLQTKFPNGTFAAKALFMVGYINANHLSNLDKAREYYSQFLEKYPDHDLADDAQYEIDNLGKDVESLPFLIGESQDDDSSGDTEKKNSSSN